MHESETQTRRKIDAVLDACGWRVVPYQEGKDYSRLEACAITEYPIETGPADYALSVKGELFAFVEAKKASLGAQNVLSQAHRYAKGVKPRKYGEYGVPFAYSSNGSEFFFQDLREKEGYSRPVAKFHTPDALIELLSSKRVAGLAWLKANVSLPARARPDL